MGKDDGFIKLSRKFFSNKMWTVSRTFSECEAWLDLIQSARFEDSEITSHIGNYEITWNRGQYPVSTSFLAKRWEWSVQKVRTFLEKLKKEKMITTNNEQGVKIITLCNYDEYNSTPNRGNKLPNHLFNQLPNQLKGLEINGLQWMCNQLPNQLPNQLSNQKKKKDKKNIKKISNANALATKESPSGEDCADSSDGELSKSWKEDFEVYKQELKAAYEALANNQTFIAERQKYAPKLDIRLSLEKAYNDYWNTEAGWKKKKAGKSMNLDWKRTFINALSLSSNKVYQSSGNKCPYQPVTESQKKFTAYLREHAPLMLDMPVQPNDEEIEDLRNISATTLNSIVEEINNNRYLTNGRNSVYQTIMEQLKKYQNG